MPAVVRTKSLRHLQIIYHCVWHNEHDCILYMSRADIVMEFSFKVLIAKFTAKDTTK
jgi:hypothetical protein